jgi:hypothetical protein
MVLELKWLVALQGHYNFPKKEHFCSVGEKGKSIKSLQWTKMKFEGHKAKGCLRRDNMQLPLFSL